MREAVRLTGMVLKAVPSGEMDKRLVILTKERGKVTAFARGARRPGSMLMACGRPFAFGQFTLYEGRDAYSLQSAEISNYFDELSTDVEGTCYGSYFLEFSDYYTRENMDGTAMLKLLYQSVRALMKPAVPNELVRRVYELKAMAINGEYTEKPPQGGQRLSQLRMGIRRAVSGRASVYLCTDRRCVRRVRAVRGDQ